MNQFSQTDSWVEFFPQSSVSVECRQPYSRGSSLGAVPEIVGMLLGEESRLYQLSYQVTPQLNTLHCWLQGQSVDLKCLVLLTETDVVNQGFYPTSLLTLGLVVSLTCQGQYYWVSQPSKGVKCLPIFWVLIYFNLAKFIQIRYSCSLRPIYRASLLKSNKLSAQLLNFLVAILKGNQWSLT